MATSLSPKDACKSLHSFSFLHSFFIEPIYQLLSSTSHQMLLVCDLLIMHVWIKIRIIARLAQSAERKALNLVVVGSSPTVGVCLFAFCAHIMSNYRSLLSIHQILEFLLYTQAHALSHLAISINDPGRTRTCNPRLRRPMPYPLGHGASDASCENVHNCYTYESILSFLLVS